VAAGQLELFEKLETISDRVEGIFRLWEVGKVLVDAAN